METDVERLQTGDCKLSPPNVFRIWTRSFTILSVVDTPCEVSIRHRVTIKSNHGMLICLIDVYLGVSASVCGGCVSPACVYTSGVKW